MRNAGLAFLLMLTVVSCNKKSDSNNAVSLSESKPKLITSIDEVKELAVQTMNPHTVCEMKNDENQVITVVVNGDSDNLVTLRFYDVNKKPYKVKSLAKDEVDLFDFIIKTNAEDLLVAGKKYIEQNTGKIVNRDDADLSIQTVSEYVSSSRLMIDKRTLTGKVEDTLETYHYDVKSTRPEKAHSVQSTTFNLINCTPMQ